MARRLQLASVLLVAAACGADVVPRAHAERARGPIFDVHLHTPLFVAGDAAGNEALRTKTMAGLRQLGVTGALLSGTHDLMETWRSEPGLRFFPGVIFPCPGGELVIAKRRCFPDGAVFPPIAALRAQHAAGRLAFLGEVTAQYAGLAPDDPKLAPYWALAEELDLPVAIHMGFTKPGAPYPDCGLPRCPTDFRMRLGDPLLLEPVLVRHPRLRVLVMHAGWPFADNMVALMWLHPRVYVDTALPARLPRAELYRHLQRLVDSGFGERILFGSDTMRGDVDNVEARIRAIEEAPFLSEKQKRDILHDSAVRFIGLASR